MADAKAMEREEQVDRYAAFSDKEIEVLYIGLGEAFVCNSLYPILRQLDREVKHQLNRRKKAARRARDGARSAANLAPVPDKEPAHGE